MKREEAAKKLGNVIAETLAYCDFPNEHYSYIPTNGVIKKLNWEICRRPRVMGSFQDSNSALMTV